ncbi:Ribonuclease VapC1 [Bienertia sinuspersici]
MKTGNKRGFVKGLDFIERFGSLAKTLARNINEMYTMLEEANEMFQEQETSDQMNNLIHNIWNK